MMFLALGTKINLTYLILIGGLETLSTLIPITINGLGIKQALGVYFFSLLGIAPEIVAARYIIGIVTQYFFGLLTTMFIKIKPLKNENIN